MAKESGITYSLTIDDSGGTGRDISADIFNFTLNTPRAVQDVTGISQSAMDRLQLLADMSISINGNFDDGANLAHAVFKDISSTSVARTVAHSISGQTLSTETFFNDYALTRGQDGSLTFAAPGQLTGGSVPTWS